VILGIILVVFNFYGIYGIYTVGKNLFKRTHFERCALFGIIKSDKKPPVSTVQEKLTSATVTSDSLNMREGPDSNNALIITLHKGDTLTIMEEYNDTKWVKVEYNGNSGFVHSDYITREKEK